MPRPQLEPARISPAASARLATFHADVVSTVERAVKDSPVVVIGMGGNPHVKKVRAALENAGVAFQYIGYGSYASKWKERLAIKLWSGWPTFPQVFVRGTLMGGEDLTVAALADGSLKKLLDAG